MINNIVILNEKLIEDCGVKFSLFYNNRDNSYRVRVSDEDVNETVGIQIFRTWGSAEKFFDKCVEMNEGVK
jgi:hypothetical protein